MNDSEVLWIENSYIIILFKFFLSNMYDIYLIKKKKIFLFLDTYLYLYIFSILSSNLIIKIHSIIDIVATHYPDNLQNEFELLYININYKLNLRFFLKILIKKENLIISISNLFNSTA